MFAKPRLLTRKQLGLVVKYLPLDPVNFDYLVSDFEAERWLVNLQYISYSPFLYSGLHLFSLYVLVKSVFSDMGAILEDPVVMMSEATRPVLSCVNHSAMKPCSCSKYALTFCSGYFCLICGSIIKLRNDSQSLSRSVCASNLRFFASGGLSACEPEEKIKGNNGLTTIAGTHQAIKLSVEFVDYVRDQRAELRAGTKVLYEFGPKSNATRRLVVESVIAQPCRNAMPTTNQSWTGCKGDFVQDCLGVRPVNPSRHWPPLIHDKGTRTIQGNCCFVVNVNSSLMILTRVFRLYIK